MLKLNKEEVHFLVTAEMKKEVADFTLFQRRR